MQAKVKSRSEASRCVPMLFSLASVFLAACSSGGPSATSGDLGVEIAQAGAAAGAPEHIPSFEGAANLTHSQAAALFAGFGITTRDFAAGRNTANSVGFILYDSEQERVLSSYNADETFNLASVTKLFTMAVVADVFRDAPIEQATPVEFADIMRASDNRRASLWMLLAYERAQNRPVDYRGFEARYPGVCYSAPVRTEQQQLDERRAAVFFLEEHQLDYPMDWDGARLVSGAGCERAGLWEGGDDRMSARQVLSVLEAFSQRTLAGRTAFETLPQREGLTGRKRDRNATLANAMASDIVAFKTGTDYAGIRNIAGYIPDGQNPHRYFYVLLVNTGRSPSDGGLIRGEHVMECFVAWSWANVRAQGPAPEGCR